MAVSQDTKDALKSRMPDLLSYYGVTNTSRNFRAFWRDDADPSATYYPDTNLVYDHGTGETYDVFALVGRVDGIESFRDQVERVASILGEHVDESVCSWRRKRKASRPLYDPPGRKGFDDDVREACMEACRVLLADEKSVAVQRAREWLSSRGLADRDTWLAYGLGFVPAFRHMNIHPSFKVKEDDAAGFVSIPHFDARGEIHYCVLRTVMSNRAAHGPNRKEWAPKGVGKPLYNEHYLKAGMDTVAVTEGPIDAISLSVMTGVHVVGLNGTSNANRFCQVLYYAKPEQRPKCVVLNLDANDKAGADASDKIATFLDEIGVDHSELEMPPGIKDANEWLQVLAGVA